MLLICNKGRQLGSIRSSTKLYWSLQRWFMSMQSFYASMLLWQVFWAPTSGSLLQWQHLIPCVAGLQQKLLAHKLAALGHLPSYIGACRCIECLANVMIPYAYCNLFRHPCEFCLLRCYTKLCYGFLLRQKGHVFTTPTFSRVPATTHNHAMVKELVVGGCFPPPSPSLDRFIAAYLSEHVGGAEVNEKNKLLCRRIGSCGSK